MFAVEKVEMELQGQFAVDLGSIVIKVTNVVGRRLWLMGSLDVVSLDSRVVRRVPDVARMLKMTDVVRFVVSEGVSLMKSILRLKRY